MEDPSLAIVIPSRKRTELIPRAIAYFTDPVVCVDALEADAYRRALPESTRLLPHPSSVNTLQRIRQWILDHVEAEVVFQCDDDIEAVWALVGHKPRRLKDPRAIEAVIRNAARNCREAGTVMFWFAPVANPVVCRSMAPFQLVGQPVGCAMGVWREAFNRDIRFDPRIQHGGVDAALRTLFHYRIIWCDLRFCFQPGPHMTARGGLAGVRTTAGLDSDDALLKARYGEAIHIHHYRKLKGRPGRISAQVRLQVQR